MPASAKKITESPAASFADDVDVAVTAGAEVKPIVALIGMAGVVTTTPVGVMVEA